MRVALVSFEFPPAIAIGGIGTYAWEAARMLQLAGLDIEVFAAGKAYENTVMSNGIRVHRIVCQDRHEFSNNVLQIFAERHRVLPFDLMESPEIGPEGSFIASLFPEIAVVCKLHTPTYLVNKLGYEKPALLQRLRYRLGALRKGRWQGLQQKIYDRSVDSEWRFAQSADEIAAPSRAIAKRLVTDWALSNDRISIFPLPFRPSSQLLDLPVANKVQTIGFIGRLEARKGVVELARAIPAILRQSPNLRFRFIGPSWPYRNGDMESWIRKHCRSVLDRITFVGAVQRDQLAGELRKCDVIVMPSRWENFPFACWEAMASGRAVIGSAAGGMGEVIQNDISGLLVPPHSPESITAAVISLAKAPERVAQLAASARQRVMEHLLPERVLPLQLASYERAIARARQRR